MDLFRRESTAVKHENAQLRAEMTNLQNSSAPGGSFHEPPPPAGAHPHGYPMQHADPQSQLPPLRNISGPEVMNGVQYQHEQRNGYRPAADRF